VTPSRRGDESNLLRDWDFDRFFPKNANGPRGSGRGSPTTTASLSRSSQLSTLKVDTKLQRASVAEAITRPVPRGYQPLKAEPSASQSIAKEQGSASGSGSGSGSASGSGSSGSTNSPAHKRQDSDSRLPTNFERGFRRENSDFFPLAKRYSAVFSGASASGSTAGSPSAQALQRSSAVYQRNSIYSSSISSKSKENDVPGAPGAAAAGTATASAKPGPAAATTTATKGAAPKTSKSLANFHFLRPRREKTESVIVLQNAAVRAQRLQQLQQQQQQQQQQQLQQQQQQQQVNALSSHQTSKSTERQTFIQKMLRT